MALAAPFAASADEAVIALITVMGLPGAGKTTLCRRLVEGGGGGSGSLQEAACVHLEFDAFLPDASIKVAAPADDVTAWKRARGRLLRSIDRLLADRRQCGADSSRRTYFAPEESAADADLELLSPSWDNRLSGLVAAAANQRPARQLVLLLDDNFYYASMRHAAFQLARFHKCGFGVIYAKASPGQLKLVNALREKPVPEGVIERMSGRLEAPNPERNAWEKWTRVLRECDMGFLDSVGHYSDDSVNGSLHSLIRDCLANPFDPPADPAEAARQAEEAREVCSLSLLHQADLRLRALVSDWLAARGEFLEAERTEMGKSAASSKRTLLAALRDGKLKVPAGLNASAPNTPEAREQLDRFLLENILLPLV